MLPQTAIEGGSFLTNLKNDAVSDVAAAGAYAIGNAFSDTSGFWTTSNPLYAAEHAALGCAASAAEGTGFASGAIGGAASAAISPLVIGQLDPTGAPPTPEQAAITTAIAMLAGGGLAGALGQNVTGAATSAENEALNNTLDHVLPGQLNEPGTQTDVAKVTESPLPQGAPTPYEEDNEDVVTVGTAPLFSAVAGGSPNASAFTIDPGTGSNDWSDSTTNSADYSAIGSTGKLGEQYLQSLGGQSQVYFSTSLGCRYVDQLINGVANESKVGYTSFTSSVQTQIAKDVELMNSGAVNGVNWNFFTSPVTGMGGPSQPLLKALQSSGIGVIVH